MKQKRKNFELMIAILGQRLIFLIKKISQKVME